MNITSIFSDIASGLGDFVPAFFKALFDGFINLFLTSTTAEGGAITYSLNPLGIFALVFIIIAMVWRFLPTVAGWLRMRVSSRRSRRRRATR